MIEIADNVKNIKKIYMSDSSLSMLLDFERVLDSLDLYTFPNWLYGELVEGPTVSRYWVKCTFMWPYNLMPDPNGAKRLSPYGAKITFETTTIKVPVKINSPDDYRDGSKKGKLVDAKIWLVSIMLPKHLMAEIKQGAVEIAGEEIDLNDLQSAFEKDLDQKSLTNSAEASGPVSAPNPAAVPSEVPGAIEPIPVPQGGLV